MIRAKKFGTMDDRDENELRVAFHVRLALNLLHSGISEYGKKSLFTGDFRANGSCYISTQR